MPPRRRVSRSTFGNARLLKSGRWQARYREDGEEKYPFPGVTFDTRAAAEDALREFWVDRRRGVTQPEQPADEDLAVFAWRWYDVHTERKTPGTQTDYRNVIRNGITRSNTQLHKVTVRAVTPLMVRGWLNALSTPWVDEQEKEHPGYGPASRRKAFRLLSMIMSAAAAEGLREGNPCDGIAPLSRGELAASTAEHYYLYLSEIARIVAAADYIPQRAHENWGLFFELAAFTGMRPQELRALWPGQVHAERQWILVDSAISGGVSKAATKRTSTKGGSRRWAYVPRPLMDRLVAWIEERNLASTQLVFPGEDGISFMWSSTYREQGWLPMCGVAGVWEDPASMLTGRHRMPKPYDLRSAIISHMLSAGVPQVDVGAQVGHQDKATTDLYTVVANAGLEDRIAVAARQATDQTRASVIDYLYTEAMATLG